MKVLKYAPQDSAKSVTDAGSEPSRRGSGMSHSAAATALAAAPAAVASARSANPVLLYFPYILQRKRT